MNILERIHEHYVFGRRVRRIADGLAALLPPRARVLDIGCGDGLLAWQIMRQRPDVRVEGIDVLVRSQTYIPVAPYCGSVLPCADGSFDVAMLVDVLHHAEDPVALLREAVRIARGLILIKDHTADGLFSHATLRFMDRVGNARHGVALLYDYWPRHKWFEVFSTLGLSAELWRQDLRLYPWPARWVFDRSLHFLARLKKEERHLPQGRHAAVRGPHDLDAFDHAHANSVGQSSASDRF
jgi:SAM-dependent methyltransferase